MSMKELKQIGNEVLEQIKSSSYFVDLYEDSLKNIRDTVLDINRNPQRNNLYNEEITINSESASVFEDNSISTERSYDNFTDFNFKDIIPPQIKQRSATEPSAPIHPPSAIQRPIPPIFNQTLVASGMGNNVDSLIAQANQVPFLYHNQQL